MKKYGLIGKSLGHSLSAELFNLKFRNEEIAARYDLYELPEIEQLRDLLSREPELHGLNVTIPYKRSIIPLLTRLDPIAQEIGAVNTVKVGADGTLTGYNTDAAGFLFSLKNFLGTSFPGRTLILGTGGASAAVAWALRTLHIPYAFVSRTPKEGQLTYDALTAQVMTEHKLIINTTPLGTYPDITSAPPIPYHLLTPRHYCHDLVYNPSTTEFMRRSAERGAHVNNGLDMLKTQARSAYAIWTS